MSKPSAFEPQAIEPIWPLAYDRHGIGLALGVSPGTIDTWRRDYGLPSVKIGQVRLFPIDLAQEWLREMADSQEEPLPDDLSFLDTIGCKYHLDNEDDDTDLDDEDEDFDDTDDEDDEFDADDDDDEEFDE